MFRAVTHPSDPDTSGPAQPGTDSTMERIRAAALRGFAERGVDGTSLRTVAQRAGVSLGLVQHYFATKTHLRAAVDQHVLRVVREAIDLSSLPAPPDDPFLEFGRRVTALLGAHPEELRYVGRAVAEGDRLAFAVFDDLVALSNTVWTDLAQRQLLRSDVDHTWAVLHSLVLVLGTVLLRSPLERHLPASLMSAQQLRRWDDAMRELLRIGLFRKTS